MTLETSTWDIQDYIKFPERQAGYLQAVFESVFDGRDPAIIAIALGDIARARGMTAVAKEAGVTREALYKALSENGDPRLSTLIGVAKALGLRFGLFPVKVSHKSKKVSVKRSAASAKLAPTKSKSVRRSPAKKPIKAA